MAGLFFAVFGLGLAGLDPAGALLLGGALAAGATRRGAAVFGAIAVLGAAALGAACSLVLGVRADDLDIVAALPEGPGAAITEIVLAVLIGLWAVLRLRKRRPRPGKPRRTRPGTPVLMGAATAWTLAALLDPTFLAVVVLAARADSWVHVGFAHLLWSLVAQLPLVVLLVAVARRTHEPVVRWLARAWARVRPAVRQVVTAALLLVALLLLADGGLYLTTGSFLID